MSDFKSIDPAEIGKLTKAELVEAYLQTRQQAEDVYAQQSAIKDLLLEKIEGGGEVVGGYTVSIAERTSFFPGVKPKEKLEKARELGAVKDAVDTAKLKRMWNKGAEIPHSVTKYPVVKEIIQED